MISSNVVSKCCQPMNRWSLCFSKRLYSEDTDYSVQATQMSKPWWITSELPPKKMSSATNIGTFPMINTYITLNNPSKTSGWSLKTLYPPGNMAGNTNYRRFSRSLHLWGMFRPAQLWVWPHRKPCMNQSWLVKQVTWRDTYSTVHTCTGSLTYIIVITLWSNT